LLEGDFDPDAGSLSNKVLSAVRQHAEGAEQSDDITILALRRA
jgi:serine phosphatase RsbU (regulator of sigma subunit)